MPEFSVVVQAKLPPGMSREHARSLVAADIHVEQDGSTGACLVSRRVDRLDAEDAIDASNRVQNEMRDHLASANAPTPVVWQTSAEPYYEPPWWQWSSLFFGTQV